LWGGYAVSNPTLNRFFSIHFTIPFLIVGLALLHLVLLHHSGSSNPFGVVPGWDRITFHPYYIIKDFFGLLVAVMLYIVLVFFWPNFLGHSDNYINANPLVTPTHIVPE
jgi:quinol-cytochrome oxidoreductase complex cytochrome b subunit